MGTDRPQKEKPSTLRRQAETRLRAGESELPPRRTESESQRLVHELAVHQVELEMQNEELRLARQELELSRNKYAELYDFAPVSYFVFDPQGLICEVNLAAARLLGTEPPQLLGKPFAQFIAEAEGREVFSLHLKAVRLQQAMLRCEIKLRCQDGRVIYGQLQSVAVASETSGKCYLDFDHRRHGAQAIGRGAAAGP